MLQSPIHHLHQEHQAHWTEFSGWRLPERYDSAITEHMAVRNACGIFDISHMACYSIKGSRSTQFLEFILCNQINKLAGQRKGLYSCLLNFAGGIIDDVIVYRIEDDHFIMVANAATREKVEAWLKEQALSFNVDINPLDDVGMLAIQGPRALDIVTSAAPRWLNSLQAMHSFECIINERHFISRTGYTGEDGFEWIMPVEEMGRIWETSIDLGAIPCGLAARDSLRLEAGLNLSGVDMDESVTPLECGLAWTIGWQSSNRVFIGRSALLRQKERGIHRFRAGLLLQDKGMMRSGQKLWSDEHAKTGVITSASYSPILARSIALARLPMDMANIQDGGSLWVELRNGRKKAWRTQVPFVRRGAEPVQGLWLLDNVSQTQEPLIKP